MAESESNNKKKADFVITGIEDFYGILGDIFSDGFGIIRSSVRNTFKVDVREDEKTYYIVAELPGIRKEEIALALDEGKLQITVTRDEKPEDEKKDFIHKERRNGSMQRSLSLPDADASQIKAKLESGELKITVAKKERADTSVKINVD